MALPISEDEFLKHTLALQRCMHLEQPTATHSVGMPQSCIVEPISVPIQWRSCGHRLAALRAARSRFRMVGPLRKMSGNRFRARPSGQISDALPASELVGARRVGYFRSQSSDPAGRRGGLAWSSRANRENDGKFCSIARPADAAARGCVAMIVEIRRDLQEEFSS